MGEIVSLKSYRTMQECRKLFSHYKVKIEKLDAIDLMVEAQKYETEFKNYPHHLLTLVKGEILMDHLKVNAKTEDLRKFAADRSEELTRRIKQRMESV